MFKPTEEYAEAAASPLRAFGWIDPCGDCEFFFFAPSNGPGLREWEPQARWNHMGPEKPAGILQEFRTPSLPQNSCHWIKFNICS